MLATDEITKVTRIKTRAGRCYKCHRFRYCEHQSESGEIICLDCIQTLRNQRLLEIIQRPEPKPTRQRKPRQKEPITEKPQEQRKPRQEKPIAVKPQKEAKPRAKYVYSIEKIQKLLEGSEKALTVKEIVASGVCGHKTSVYRTLDRLIEIGAVVSSSDTAKNRVFIDKIGFTYYKLSEPLDGVKKPK